MKKSKLIVPAALAIMLLGTAASVSSTVAWFSSNRAVELSTTSLSVKSIDGNLTLEGKNEVGTLLGDSYAEISQINFTTARHAVMTDGSVDLSGNVYRKSYKSTETTNFTVSDKTTEGYKRAVGDTDYYFAMSWDLKFSYDFAGDATQVNLYLDPSSKIYQMDNNQEVAWGASNSTYKGFRVAFIAGNHSTLSSNSTKVWAPEQNENLCGFVNSVNNNFAVVGTNDTAIPETDPVQYNSDGYHGGQYNQPVEQTPVINLIAKNTTGTVAATAESGAASAPNCLGSFNKEASNDPSTLEFTCFAWFEGTDPNIVTSAQTYFDTLFASIKFFTRQNASA